MNYSELAPRGGTALLDPERVLYLATHMHTFDDYGVDNVSICLGALPDEEGAYILTRSAVQLWAWFFEDAEEAAASFRHFRASPSADWAYCVTDGGLLPLIAHHGFLPQLQLESAPEGNIRFYRAPEGHQNQHTPVLIRFPFPADARPDETGGTETDAEGRTRHNVFLTTQLPLPIEIDLQIDDDWYPVAELGRSLQVTTEISRLAAELAENKTL